MHLIDNLEKKTTTTYWRSFYFSSFFVWGWPIYDHFMISEKICLLSAWREINFTQLSPLAAVPKLFFQLKLCYALIRSMLPVLRCWPHWMKNYDFLETKVRYEEVTNGWPKFLLFRTNSTSRPKAKVHLSLLFSRNLTYSPKTKYVIKTSSSYWVTIAF